MVKVVANQPYYFPLLHWWERALRGKSVLLDDVQRSPKYPVNRAILFDGVKDTVLTVPIRSEDRAAKIDEILVSDPAWYVDHCNRMDAYYRKAPYRAEAEEVLGEFFPAAARCTMMVDVIEASIDCMKRYLGLDMEIHRSRDLPLQGTKRSSRMIKACKLLGGDTLVLGGSAPKGYLEEDAALYEEAGVAVEIQDWKSPVENRSILDALARLGRDRVLEVLGYGA